MISHHSTFFSLFLALLLISFLFPALSFGETLDDSGVTKSGVTKEGLSSERVLKFGADGDYPPLSFYEDGKNEGRLRGFDVDLVHHIEQLTPLSVELEAGKWVNILESLREGRIDVVCGILKTPERSRDFDFTIPYFFDSYMVFVSSGSGIGSVDDLAGHNAAVLAGDAIIESFLSPHGLDRSMKLTSSFSRALKMVAAGEADYTIAPFSLGERTIRGLGLSGIKNIGRPLFTMEYRFAVQKGNGELLAMLNDTLAQLWNSGRLEGIHRKWKVWKSFDHSSIDPVSPLYLKLALGILILALLIGLWYLSLRIWVRREVAAREEETTFYRNLLKALPLPLSWWDSERDQRASNGRWDEVSISRLEEQALQTGKRTSIYRDGGKQKLTVVPIKDEEKAGGTVALLEDHKDLIELRSSLEKMTVELTETKREADELKLRDPLTSFFNEAAIKKRIEEEIVLFQRYGKLFSLVLLSFRPGAVHPGGKKSGTVHFASGHSAFKEFLELIRQNLRDTDMASRIGDSLFLIFLPRTGKVDALRLPERIRESLGSGQLLVSVETWDGGELASLLEKMEVDLRP